MADTVDLVGQGGVVQTFDLPLPDVFAEQLAKGHLRLADESATDPASSNGRPDEKANKAVWSDYAASLGADPDFLATATKAQLVAFTPPDPDTPDPEPDAEYTEAEWAEIAQFLAGLDPEV